MATRSAALPKMATLVHLPHMATLVHLSHMATLVHLPAHSIEDGARMFKFNSMGRRGGEKLHSVHMSGDSSRLAVGGEAHGKGFIKVFSVNW
jgi:hypothetical protein